MNREITSPRSPNTSSANPCNAFFGPTSTKTARAGIVERVQSLHELDGTSDLLREQVQHLRNNIWSRGIELAVYVGDDRQRGGCICRCDSISRSGSLAGATIDVWNAWLTGSGTTL